MRNWSKASLQKLAGVHPDLRRVMDRALQSSPIDFKVIDGVRSIERQRELVAKGASKTMKSRHLTGHAVDLWPIDPATGKAATNNDARLWALYHQIAPAVKAAAKAERVPVEWGGDWKSFKDGPHWQLPHAQYPEGAPVKAPPAPPTAEAIVNPVLKDQVVNHGGFWAGFFAALLSPFRKMFGG